MIHALRAIIFIEAIVILMPFLRLGYAQFKSNHPWTTVRTVAVVLYCGQQIIVQVFRWDANTFFWYAQPLTIIILSITGIVLYAQVWRKDPLVTLVEGE